MESLDVDDLMPLMPAEVLNEYKLHGDAAAFGFTPGVKNWLEHSTHPRIERWRHDLRRFTAQNVEYAIKEQERMAEVARAAYAGATGSIRCRAVIHPVIKGWMETQHGPSIFKDRDALADTERLQPKLFFNK